MQEISEEYRGLDYCSLGYIQKCIDEGCPEPVIVEVGYSLPGSVMVVSIDATFWLVVVGSLVAFAG